MKQTLYISDLDGTLLNRDGELSEYTTSVVRRVIQEGGLFTIATARSQQAAGPIMSQLGLQLPAVLTNGSTIYDPVGSTYVQVATLPPEALLELFHILESHNICGFLYTMREELLTVYYRRFCHEGDAAYRDRRVERYSGRFYQADDLVQAAGEATPVYVVAYGPLESLSGVRAQLKQLPELTCELYSDVYYDSFFLDIFPATASKGNGMLTLQKLTGAEELVAFGDNYNDLSMLAAAHRAYVPRNAVDAAKDVATGVLGSCDEDGVARFLAQELGFD